MKLTDLEKYEFITIQCHDNPDADAIGSGYALYKYFESKGKNVRLIYGGKNKIKKTNLVLLINRFEIPIEYVFKNENEKIQGLLITVDCQYGAGNVTKLEADDIAIIDHHQVEIENVEKSIIRPELGSCATLVWLMLREAGFEINDDCGVSTALYYGLYTDTNQLSEMFNPLDFDLIDQVDFNAAIVNLLRNSNITLKELDVAGMAMLRYSVNEKYGFAINRAEPCDPNILGLISDFILQVDSIKCCVVFNEIADGYKLSIRSCATDVNASELAKYLTKDIGSGGGNYEKAGGFIVDKFLKNKNNSYNIDLYINMRMTEYFETYEIIYAEKYEADVTTMKMYQKKPLPIGFVRTNEILPEGTPITVRSIEGDMDLTVDDELYIMIGIKGEVYSNKKSKFEKSNKVIDETYVYNDRVIENTYVPKIKNRITGENISLEKYAHVCVPTGKVKIYAKKLEKGVKVFTSWDKNKYMLGQAGDYLAVRCDDMHDVYIIENNIFDMTYELKES